MPSYPYIDGAGNTRERKVLNAGTVADPDIGLVADVDTLAGVTSIANKLPTLGQKAQSGSVSIVPATGASIIIKGDNYSNFVSMGVSAGGNVKAAQGSIYSFSATNANTSTRFIQFFNKATAPTAGDVPMLSYPVYGNFGMLTVDQMLWGINGIGISTGISWGFSTTPLVYTAGVGTEVIFDLRFT